MGVTSRMYSLPLFVYSCFLFFSQGVSSAPTQQFSFGIVQGNDILSKTSNQVVYAYYGIPFAEAPIGRLRFEAPVPFAGRDPSRVISSTGFRASCLQPSPTFGPQSEDCLHLNIFVPSTNTGQDKKVMVWIHGGGYTVGDAVSYSATDMVADYDVIWVSIQYRLGYFGLLSSGDEATSSNNALRDQQLALRWVKDNIRAFGGDADDVTIIGESAGSSSVSLLSLSPLSNGLFEKAIMQSGTALSIFGFLPKPYARQRFYEFAGRLKCLSWWKSYIPGSTVTYHKEILECLRNKLPEEINTPMESTSSEFIQSFFDYGYAFPTNDEDVLPNIPRALLKDENYLRTNGVLDRTYIVGFTNNEGYFVKNDEEIPYWTTEQNVQRLAKVSAEYYYPLSTNDEVIHMIDFVYTYPRENDGTPAFQSMANLITDNNFGYPSVEFVTLLTEASASTNVYLYLFDHYPETKLPQNSSQPRQGTNHASDLGFLFDADTPGADYYAPTLDLNTPEARVMMNVYRNTLSQFAKTGNPSYTGSLATPTVWPRFEGKDRHYLAYGPQPEARQHLYSQRMSLWQDYLPKVATNVFTGRKGVVF